ncbi:GAD-like domain-containing protein [Pseudoduganella albidiflava]|uniref:DUF1851 domain-containing protein n=1 Tax=Pseudoduganella albidiflava TaxID=321983 RepID=A0A411X187_9BURK|nr:GAD-like domain-containing protein [Pseudoduganella albidiflava]QBI02730.1 DUF1851 domain-containing protein [Pseudoduganella albidiflava]GGY70961.1 hypothetical protein GCM10007387_60880 [Pseudoduganella albidiflava]
MRDEYYSHFISKFGEKTFIQHPTSETIAEWRGTLPDQLLTYWEEEGWGAFADGLFWIVDPKEYENIKDEWLAGTVLEKADKFHVIARSAFGKLFLWGEKTGPSATILPYANSISTLPKDLKRSISDPDEEVRMFFGFTKKEYCDLKDIKKQPLFLRALKKLGALSRDEIYGFEPALILGGDMSITNLSKVNIDAHLTILHELADPTLPFSQLDF